MEMFLTAEFWYGLLAIIMIDLVLAGDNAIVIGLAARNLPKEQQKKAIIWGTFGAVIIRAICTLLVVWLLKIPGLLLIGGAMLVWIAIKLLADDKGHEIKAGNSLGSAIRTIIIADAVMGLDNVIAVAGAAHGSFWLVVLGLLISVPIMVWGSTLILKVMERFPSIIYVGAAILAITAGSMITGEPLLKPFFIGSPLLQWGFIAIIVGAVLLIGKRKKQHAEKKQIEEPALDSHSA